MSLQIDQPDVMTQAHEIERTLTQLIAIAQGGDSRGEPTGATWLTIAQHEFQLSMLYPSESLDGGIARVGVITALQTALNRYVLEFLADPYLPEERKQKIREAVKIQ